MDARYIAVLEIGSSKIKGAVARMHPDGTGATLVAAHEVKCVGSVRHGRVQNVQEVAARTQEVLRRLENHPEVAPRRLRRVRVALGGRSLASVSAHASISLPGEVEITPEIIDRLKREAVRNLPANRRVVAVLPRTYTVDGAEVANPVGTFGHTIAADLTVLPCAPENLTNLERVRTEAAGDEATPIERLYIPRQQAIAQMALTPGECQIGVVLVDMGAETTTVSIHRGGVLQYLATLPMGGRNITRDLAGGLSVTEDQAEYIKTAQASALPDQAQDALSPEARDISNYSYARADELVANILHRIEVAGFRAADLPGGIVLTGGAAGMRRMAELVGKRSEMKVRTATADNSVGIGNTGLDPVDDLDLLALAAWPTAAADSDLTEKPAPEPEPHEPYETHRTYKPYSDDPDEENLLDDDPDEGDEPRKSKKLKGTKKTKKTVDPEPLGDEEEDDDEPRRGGGFFGKLKKAVSRLGTGIVGEGGHDNIDD